jgi:hypothetical protein
MLFMDGFFNLRFEILSSITNSVRHPSSPSIRFVISVCGAFRLKPATKEMFLFMVRSVVYAIKTFLNLAHMFIADKRPKNCRLMVCYAMTSYVTECTTCKSIAKQTAGFWNDTQDARKKAFQKKYTTSRALVQRLVVLEEGFTEAVNETKIQRRCEVKDCSPTM